MLASYLRHHFRERQSRYTNTRDNNNFMEKCINGASDGGRHNQRKYKKLHPGLASYNL